MPHRNIDRLLEIMARLRDPKGGCPWDVRQDFASIAPYTIEEAYEVAEAIESGNLDALRDELGDLLLQVVFHSRIAEEAGYFTFEDVAKSISDKMIRRHPHVFGEDEVRDVESQRMAWEAHKEAERAAQAAIEGATEVKSALDGVARALPALMRAVKLQRRAARVGFDWERVGEVLEKIEEELGELRAELMQDAPPDRLEDELGDLLFALTNLARRLELDPETALRRSTAKFERRFRRVETLLMERGKLPSQSTLTEMDSLWAQAKLEERGKGKP